jgi:hypothetical protein
MMNMGGAFNGLSSKKHLKVSSVIRCHLLFVRARVGVLVRGRTSEITEEQADQEAFEEAVGNLEEPYRGIVTNYVERLTHYDRERDRLRREIATRKIQLDGLKCPFWMDELLRPIAEHLLEQPEFADRTYDVLGPFGIGSRASIHLYKKGVPIIRIVYSEVLKLKIPEIWKVRLSDTIGEIDYRLILGN